VDSNSRRPGEGDTRSNVREGGKTTARKNGQVEKSGKVLFTVTESQMKEGAKKGYCDPYGVEGCLRRRKIMTGGPRVTNGHLVGIASTHPHGNGELRNRDARAVKPFKIRGGMKRKTLGGAIRWRGDVTDL